MKKLDLPAITFLLALSLCAAPLASAQDATVAVKKDFIKNYGAIGEAVFAGAHKQAVALDGSIKAFTEAPSEETHRAAKAAWLAARVAFLQTGAFHSLGASRALIDASPIDAGYIDYTLFDERAGFIAKPAQALDGDAVMALNQAGGERNVSCGFHAIEFLLWGADRNETGPGGRLFIDFVEGRKPNAERRAAYLSTCAGLLVKQLEAAALEWKPGIDGNARAKLEAKPTAQALGQILTGIGDFSAQLAEKGVAVPYKSKDQADELSNFSDTTHLDLMYGTSGIANLVAGVFIGADKKPRVQGVGLLGVVSAHDKDRGEDLKLATNRMMLAVTSFRPPFDRALSAPDDSPAREGLKEIEVSLRGFAEFSGQLVEELGASASQPEPAE